MMCLTIITSSKLAAHRSEYGSGSKEYQTCPTWHFSTDTGPFVTNDGSTESYDQELSNDMLILVCREVWVACSVHNLACRICFDYFLTIF